MTTPSSHNDQLLDLLYGECTPEEEARLRAAIDQDRDLQRKWEELQADHQAVSTSIPAPVAVPEELTAKILQNASKASKPSRRAPNGAAPPRGLWHSMVSGKLRAPVILAAILISSSVVIAYMFGSVDELFIKAQPEVSSISIGAGSSSSRPSPAPQAMLADDLAEEAEASPVMPDFESLLEPVSSPRQEEAGAPAPAPAFQAPREESRESAAGARAAAPAPAPSPTPREPEASPPLDSIGSATLGRGGGGLAREESLDRLASGSAAPAPRPTRARASSPERLERRSAPTRSAPPALDTEILLDSYGAAASDAEIAEAAPVAEEEPVQQSRSAAALLDEAREAFEEGDREKALRLLEKALAAETLDSDAQRRADALRQELQPEDPSPAQSEPLPASEP